MKIEVVLAGLRLYFWTLRGRQLLFLEKQLIKGKQKEL